MAPAPFWTNTEKPIETNFLTVSGVAETRVSPESTSIGTKILGKGKTGLLIKDKTAKVLRPGFLLKKAFP